MRKRIRNSYWQTAGRKSPEQEQSVPFFQAKLTVNAPGDTHEQEADRVADQVMRMKEEDAPAVRQVSHSPASEVQRESMQSGREEEEQIQRKESGSGGGNNSAPSIVGDVLSSGSGRPMDDCARQLMESRFGQDFSQVRIQTDVRAAESAAAIQARAFTSGRDIVFGAREYQPSTSAGQWLLAHELAHVGQQSDGNKVFRATTGKAVQQNVDTLTQEFDDVKKFSDVVKAALKEISAGKSVQFNTDAIKKTYLPKLASLTGNALSSLEAEWLWLAKNTKDKGFAARKSAFLDLITSSDLKSVKTQFPKSQAHDWIRNTDTGIFDLILKTANTDVTAEQLYAYASNEGLSLFIKGQKIALPVGKKVADQPISGFDSLGLDDFMTDLSAKRKPLKKYLPTGYNLSALTPQDAVNEKKRVVHSAIFPNVESGLQALMAAITRKRELFTEDAKAQGYTVPTTDEKVFWTYVYFNPGEFGGLAQLKKYKGARKLSDWISKGEYKDAQRVLQGYQAVKAMKIF